MRPRIGRLGRFVRVIVLLGDDAGWPPRSTAKGAKAAPTSEGAPERGHHRAHRLGLRCAPRRVVGRPAHRRRAPERRPEHAEPQELLERGGVRHGAAQEATTTGGAIAREKARAPGGRCPRCPRVGERAARRAARRRGRRSPRPRRGRRVVRSRRRVVGHGLHEGFVEVLVHAAQSIEALGVVLELREREVLVSHRLAQPRGRPRDLHRLAHQGRVRERVPQLRVRVEGLAQPRVRLDRRAHRVGVLHQRARQRRLQHGAHRRRVAQQPPLHLLEAAGGAERAAARAAAAEERMLVGEAAAAKRR
mmetsp:Transcript_7042/g.29343  ORF Transcript_7042/g.29343 Transcript_7042/m.29343 type:complete len:305 (-) Transcript_7042:372-1286(-)